jgi:hypothetical protein
MPLTWRTHPNQTINSKGNHMSAMMYLIAIFVPPLYFLTKKKWLGFAISSFLLIVSFFLFITVVFIPIALIFWGLCSVVAIWDVRKQLVNEHATIIAEKMAAKMRPSPQPSEPKPTP